MRTGFLSRRRFSGLFLGVAAVVLAASASTAAEKLTWKPVADALLKVDDHPVKLWNVYRAAKHSHLVLIQLGQRHLMLNTKEKQIYEISSSTLARKGDELSGRAPDKAEKPLASSDWEVRDVGLAQMVRVRLAEEGRLLEVQLPHPIDLRLPY